MCIIKYQTHSLSQSPSSQARFLRVVCVCIHGNPRHPRRAPRQPVLSSNSNTIGSIWFCSFQIQIFKLGRERVARRLSPASAGYLVFVTNGSERSQSPTGAPCDGQPPAEKGKLGDKTKTPACKARTGVSAKSLFRLCAPFNREAPERPWSLEKLPGSGCLAQRLALCRSSQAPLAHGPRPQTLCSQRSNLWKTVCLDYLLLLTSY